MTAPPAPHPDSDRSSTRRWRLLLAILATALVVLVAIAAISFFHLSFLRFGRLGQYAIVSDRGTLQYRCSWETQLQPGVAGAPPRVIPATNPVGPVTRRMRFTFSPWRYRLAGRGIMSTGISLAGGKVLTYGYNVAIWGIADWVPAAALALLLIWPGWKLRQDRLQRIAGHCRTCGYDLRASIDRCPECGTALGVMRRFGFPQPRP